MHFFILYLKPENQVKILKRLLNFSLANEKLKWTVCNKIMVTSEAATVELTDRSVTNHINYILQHYQEIKLPYS